jgi:hypothetical protein
MKIGLSYSRCIRDIVDGVVDINDVLVVIARTNFDPHNDEQWTGIWEGYGGGQQFGSPFSNPEWIDYPAEDEAKFRKVTIDLWEQGKFHQPRKFGARPQRRSEFWLETCLPSSELERNPAAKIAWDNFQVIAGLTNVKLDKDYQ